MLWFLTTRTLLESSHIMPFSRSMLAAIMANQHCLEISEVSWGCGPCVNGWLCDELEIRADFMLVAFALLFMLLVVLVGLEGWSLGCDYWCDG